jgi:hypothetical protein
MIMPLIEEKKGFDLPAFIRTNVAPAAYMLRPWRETFLATGATKPQRSQCLFITAHGSGIGKG